MQKTRIMFLRNTDYTDLKSDYTDGTSHPCNHGKISEISDKGFTLVEVLVAASILGMVALAVMAAFGAGMRAFDRVRSFGGEQADVLLALEGMERDLHNAFYLSNIKFQGGSDKISFAGLAKKLEKDEQGEEKESIFLAEKSYYFDTQKKTLIREEKDYPEAVSASSGGETSEVVAHIEKLAFHYYFYKNEVKGDKENITYGWQDSWSDQEEAIPKGVKIEITFKEGDRDVAFVRTVFLPAGGEKIIEKDEEGGTGGEESGGDTGA